jgi:hypothetical protein
MAERNGKLCGPSLLQPFWVLGHTVNISINDRVYDDAIKQEKNKRPNNAEGNFSDDKSSWQQTLPKPKSDRTAESKKRRNHDNADDNIIHSIGSNDVKMFLEKVTNNCR